MIPNKKLDFWIQNNYNVILRGRHGVGKTACIKEAFERNNLKWLYFSASTMDPWVDFIGVPKEREVNGVCYLDLVRPKAFVEDDVEAIFFDEYNRSHSKIRNAVMELIQFKSINGKQFKNLRFIWAAINPENKEEDNELEYNVEPVDPAQLDRFHIIYDVSYSLDKIYFKNKYGQDISEAAYSWWQALDQKTKFQISPRRLDYALDIYTKNGDMRDVLPNCANVSKLTTELTQGSYTVRLKKIIEKKDPTELKDFIQNENNYTNCIEAICKNMDSVKLFIPYLSQEKIVSLLSKYSHVLQYIIKNENDFKDLIVNLVLGDSSKSKISKKLRNNTTVWKCNTVPANTVQNPILVDQVKTLINHQHGLKLKSTDSNADLKNNIQTILLNNLYHGGQTYYKFKAYDMIYNSINNTDNINYDTSDIAKILEYIFKHMSNMQYGTLTRNNHNVRDFVKFLHFCFSELESKANTSPAAKADYESCIGILAKSEKIQKVMGIDKNLMMNTLTTTMAKDVNNAINQNILNSFQNAATFWSNTITVDHDDYYQKTTPQWVSNITGGSEAIDKFLGKMKNGK